MRGKMLLTRVLTQYGMRAKPMMPDGDLAEPLIEKARVYHPDVDADLLRRAYAYAAEKHEGQTRRSGEPYITHPLAVATILTELEMDDATLAAGLLHDVVEDCGVSRDQLAQEGRGDLGASQSCAGASRRCGPRWRETSRTASSCAWPSTPPC